MLNLISVAKIASHGKTIVFDKENCCIMNGQVATDDYQVLATGTNENGKYRLACAYDLGCTVGKLTKEILWHKRLEHLTH